MKNNTAEQSVRESLEAIAKKSGISVEEVRQEIEIALAAARENSDPNIQAFWKLVPCKGEVPTSEEVIVYIAGMGRGISH